MELKLAVDVGGRYPYDVAVQYADDLQVGELASLLASATNGSSPDSPTLRLEGDHRTLDPDVLVIDTALRQGAVVSIVDAPSEAFRLPGATGVLEVTSGPARGRSFELRSGNNTIGRDPQCHIHIADSGISRTHATIRLSDEIAIADQGSKNGTYINGERLRSSRTLAASDVVTMGNTQCRVRSLHGPAASTIPFNRPPRAERSLRPTELTIPDPPDAQRKSRIPIVGIAAPLVMAVGTFIFSGGSSGAALLVAGLSPLLMIARHFETSWFGRRAYEQAVDKWSGALSAVRRQRDDALAVESEYMKERVPTSHEVMTTALLRSSRLWERAPEHEDFLCVGIGTGESVASSLDIKPPRRASNEDLAGAWSEIARVPALAAVPVPLDLKEVGNFGLASGRLTSGSDASSVPLIDAAARSVVVQLSGLHSPRELEICAVVSESRRSSWDWLKWLPHTDPAMSILGCHKLAVGVAASNQLVADLTALIAGRSATTRSNGPPSIPIICLVLDETCGLDPARVGPVLERGPSVGVHTIWVGTTTAKIPAACGASVELIERRRATLTIAGTDARSVEIDPDTVASDAAVRFARSLAPVVDSSQPGISGDIPGVVPFSTLVDPPLITEPATLIRQWSSAPTALAAPVGATSSGPFVIDVRVDGPHGLVAGTTGAGKSEFLQCFVASLAAIHPPSRVAFLFVDYKGGAAFRGCESLPHSVGMVTDLDAHLVERVLVSLRAELTRRELILEGAGAKDLVALEKMSHPETPPNLLIVIDEFAALSKEIPEFVDGVVDIAQRGRSLGLHLLLATQRPAGVVTDYIRANMNLRVALRVASVDESVDVIAAKDAANIGRDTPGRAVARLGPSDLIAFQSGFAGAPLQSGGRSVEPRVAPFGLDPISYPPRRKRELVSDATELSSFVHTASTAAGQLRLEPPHRPWLAPLAPAYGLEDLGDPLQPGTLLLGLSDVPEKQLQTPSAVSFGDRGHVMIVGTSGAGKTTTLRTLAAAAQMSEESWWVYGFDFAGRTLRSIEPLPRAGSIVAGDDYERVVRLFRMLRGSVDKRLSELGDRGVADFGELREITGDSDKARILVLLDGLHAFLADYERIDGGQWIDELARLISDGRPAGVHFAIATDRRSGIPMRIASQVQETLVLRLASTDDYAMANVKPEALGDNPPPGRGLLGGVEIQVATVGGATDGPGQIAAIHDLSGRSLSPTETPPTIERLPEMVRWQDQKTPILGIQDIDLAPISVPLDAGLFGVFGPRRSGRTNALHVVCSGLKHASPSARALLVSTGRPNQTPDCWDRVLPHEAATAEMIAEFASQLKQPGQLIVAVDDWSDFVMPELDDAIASLFPASRSLMCRIIIADEAAAARSAYGSKTIGEIRKAKTGLLLTPDVSTDGDLFGLTISRLRMAPVPGRGVLSIRGSTEVVQTAILDAPPR